MAEEKVEIISPKDRCKGCGNPLTPENISKTDFSFCNNCLHDVSVTITKVTKTEIVEDYDLEQDKPVPIETREFKARQIKIEGPDWVFHSKIISQMTEDELRIGIQFRKASVSLMESELVERKIKKEKAQFGGVRIGGNVVTSKTSKEVKTTKTTRSVKKDPVQQLLELLSKSGLSDEQIQFVLENRKKNGTTE